MPDPRAAVCAALLTIAGLTVGACGATGRPEETRATLPQPSSRTAAPRQEDPMKISIAVGEERFQATLLDSAAGRDLIAQLPLTVAMTDHGSVEKTGPLPSPLSLDGQPDGADPDVGDVGYYAPGNDLVLYYGDQSYYPGIVVIGRLDGDAAARIAGMDGAVTATVDVHTG
jgi:hypothetical protein